MAEADYGRTIVNAVFTNLTGQYRFVASDQQQYEVDVAGLNP
jgi:hypothetical protein